MPKFLLAEEPKGGDFHYVYSPPYLSLVMIVPEETSVATNNIGNIKVPRKTYQYENETFDLIVVQNNVKVAGGVIGRVVSEIEFLDEA